MKEQIREIINSFPNYEEIIKHIDGIDTPEGQDQFTHDKAFGDGALWMKDRVSSILEKINIGNNYQTKDLMIAMLESQLKVERFKYSEIKRLGMYSVHRHITIESTIEELERQLNELKK